MKSNLTFRRDLQVSKYDHEGEDRSLVLKDPVSGKFYYVSEYEYCLMKSFDGSLSFEEVMKNLSAQGHYYSSQDAQAIIGKAAHWGLLLGTKFGTAEYQKALKKQMESAKKSQRYSKLYFLFIPLVNPDAFLEKTLGIFQFLVNRWTGMFFAAAFPIALYFVISDHSKFDTEYLFFFNFENLIYLWVTLTLTKLLHELAHAYTAKSYGLRVPEMGVAFLIFFPCLFCNTTEAWQLANRRQRITISAAGIFAEAALSTIAVFIWYFTKPGVVNSLAFYLMAISFFSTILFNANPLMRFDGYFILIDWLRLPNLYARAQGYLRFLFMNRVMGISTVPSTATTPRESAIFALYGISAFFYRVFLYTSIVTRVYYRFDKFLGFSLGLTAFVLFIVRPIVKGTRSLITQRKSIRLRPVGAICFGLVVATIFFGLFTPIADSTSYPCFIASAKSQKLTVPLYTAVNEVFVEERSLVKAGQVLFTLDTAELRKMFRQKEIELELAKKEHHILVVDDKQKAESASKEIQIRRLGDELARITRDLKIAEGDIRAPFDGVITKLDPRMQAGFQPGDGVVVGELESPKDYQVHVLIPEDDLAKIKPGDTGTVWLRQGTGWEFRGKINEIRPYSEHDLKDSPFSSRLGGEVAVETAEEQHTDIPLEARYLGIVAAANAEAVPLGITGRFFHSCPPRSLGRKMFDRVVKEFNRERLF